VFVGFGALISFTRRNEIEPIQLGQIRAVVTSGLVVIVAALLPVGLSRYGVGGHSLWFLSSLIFLLLVWAVIVLSLRRPENRRIVASEARATANPTRYCEGETGRVDALGSFCAACPSLDYQWYEDDSPISGATGVVHSIPPAQAVGHYGFSVEIGCATNPDCTDMSNPVEVTVLVVADEVGTTLTVDKINHEADLLFRWTDVPGAEDYVVFSDSDPTGSFEIEEGNSPSGETGLILTVPEAELSFYLVAGRNPDCGVGPK